MNRWTRRGLLVAMAWCALVAPAQAADLEVRNLSTDRYFTPNGDGSEDIGRVTYGLSNAASVDVTITDTNGTVVRKVLSHAAQPEAWSDNAFTWNGLDDAGLEAPPGEYRYTIRAETGGAVATATGRIGILRGTPGELTAPVPGASLAGDADARFVPAPGYTVSSVFFRAYSGGLLSTPSVPRNPDGSYSYRFDSSRMTNGANRVQAQLSWRDGFNQSHSYVAEVPVTVLNPIRFSGLTRDAAFSPNGDGVEDVTTTNVTLANGDADITVRVLDGNGNAIKTLLSGHEDSYVSVPWDGTDSNGAAMPDGEYDIEIAATNAAGTTMTIRSVAIDTQLVGAFVAPAPGHALTGTERVAFVPRTGLNVNYVDYTGTCPNRLPGQCALGTAYYADLDGSWPTDIDSSKMIDGQNALIASVRFNDAYGAPHSWPVTLPVHVNNPVKFGNGFGIGAFTPNGDGQEDTAQVGFSISRDATLDITFASAGGTILRHLDDVPATADYSWFTWDGRDDDGDVVPDGIYTWTITATDSDGGTGTSSGELQVVTTLPGTITAPTAGATLSGPFDVTFEADPAVDVASVNFYRCDGPSWECFVGSAEPDADGIATATLSDENRAQGDWQLTADVHWRDAWDLDHSYRSPGVAVTIADPLHISVDETEDAWFMGGGSFDTRFQLNRPAHVTATVVNQAGETVSTILDDDISTGNQVVSWDGRRDGHVVPHDCEVDPDAEEPPAEGDCDEWVPGDPLPGGVYEIRLRAVDAGEETTGSQTVRLETRPPGELVTPRDGDTLSRQQAFVVRVPDDYPEQPFRVRFCLAGTCEDAYRADDGLFRTAIDTTAMDNGEAELDYAVHWGWMEGEMGWQVTRTWHGRATVTISDVAPEVTLAADPAHGDAPLASALAIHATDSVGPLDYTLNFGDGTPPQTGTIAPPYDEIERPHTYTEPGVYHAHVMVTDQDGNSAQRTVDVVATTPTVPVPTTGSLAVRLATEPAADLGRFNLFVDSAKVKSGARNGQGSAPQTVGAGMHVVAVGAGAATTMDHYDPSIVCRDGDGSGGIVAQTAHANGLNVPVAGGAHVVCAVLSTHLTAELAVRLRGEGAGTVTSSPAGLLCSAPECTASFLRGGAVRLTAVPAPGSTFEGWEDVEECQGLGDCTVTMNGGRGVSARFEKVGLKAVGGEDLRGEEDSAMAFDGRASRPVATIDSYRWDFGDGASATTARATHEYADPGRYTAKLTVTADGETDSDEVAVRVDERDDGRGLYVTVREENGLIGGADVVVNDSHGDRVQERTGGDGRARLRGLADGRYSVYVNAGGYVPAVASARIDDGTGTVTVDMEQGELAAVDVQTRELSEDEIRAAGIDPEDPDNQQVLKTDIRLCFSAGGDCQDLGGYVGSGSGGAWYDGGGGGGGGSMDCWCATFKLKDFGSGPDRNYTVSGVPAMVDGHPVVVWMGMPVGGGFMKQFFEIKLLVTNLAPSEIRFAGGQATLNLPAGMSLAPTADPQSLSVAIPDIPGGGSRGADWVVRGDSAGSYSPTISYTARLQPFDTPIALSAQTPQPLRIWGAADALRVLVDADDTAVRGEPYRVRLGVRNVSSGADAASVYNPSVSIGDGEGFIYQPRQRRTFAIDGVAPGQTYWTDDVILIPRAGGHLDVLSSVVADAAGGAAGTGGVVEHTPQRTYGFKGYRDGTLRWKAVPGAGRYEIYSVPAAGEDAFPVDQFPGTPVASSAGTEVHIPGGGGADKWYAVSTIVGGKNVMFHPITQATLPPDQDDDGVPDDVDNCPAKPNPGQADKDDDGKGDACDAHDDRDDVDDDEDDPVDDGDDIGPPKPDKDCDGKYHIDFGPVEAIASCFKRIGADQWKSSARVRVGGLDIKPGSGSADIVLDGKDWEIKTTGSVEVKAGPVTLWRAPINWRWKSDVVFKAEKGAFLKGLPFTGELRVQLVRGGVKILANVGLPGTLGGVTGQTTLRLTNEDGLRLDNLALNIPGFEIRGKLGVEAATLTYQRDATDDEVGTWAGGATVLIPKAGLTRLGIQGYVAISGGALKELSGGVDGLNWLIGEGFFLQRLRARLITYPFAFGGGAGISFGPQVMGNEAGSLDGDLLLKLEGPDEYKATGKLRVAEVTMATGYVTYAPGRAFDFGGTFQWRKFGVGVEANVDGWVDGVRSFNAHGDSKLSLSSDLWVGGESNLSNAGIAACRRGWGPDVGWGYSWGDWAPHIFASSCDVGPWTANRSLARAASASLGTTVPPDLPVATFAVTGKDAPPRVVLTAPDGLKITTPAGGASLSNDRVLLFQNPADKTTYVAVKAPAAGNWRIDELPGSAAVTGVRHANGLPEPQVSGRVVASGRRRTLRYAVKPIPGQRVEFTERMPGGRVRVLGTARGRRGRIAIKPAPGPRGKRRIVAQVLQYDLPREELAVASYSPPKSPSGRIKRLHLTARGGRLKASWKRVAGAKAYRVAVKVSDGRRLLYLDQRKPSLTIPRVTRGMRVTVQVRAAALLTGTPPTTTRSIKVRR